MFRSGVEHSIKKWVCSPDVKPKAEDLAILKDRIEFSSELNSVNADLWFQRGQLYALMASTTSVWTPDARELRLETEEQYWKTLTIRPEWTVAWINLLQTRILTGQIDRTTLSIIDKVIKKGKWQLDVQRQLIWIIFGTWDSLSPNRQARVSKHIAQVMEKDTLFDAAVASALNYKKISTLKQFPLSKELRRKLRQTLADEEKMASLKRHERATSGYC
ncbi:MAG: hypothetical protein OEX00_04000 [Gammaproteobacteria bacterium]|nr:hypothetical protein [Gammaproteobacteria bacterium]MDH5692221.1 hypothetical protein [Gammaproteobacteria bacterium]